MTASDPSAAGPGRPNVVVFIADQLRADHLGFAGHPLVRTPHLDRLAEQSTVFTGATVANPTCMPNRASLMTGRWPSAHGTRCNGIPLDPDASTLPRQLARAGYRTAAVGKLHHQNMGWDFEPEQAAEIRATDPLLLEEAAVDAVARTRSPGWDQWENRDRHDAVYLPLPPDYYGYDDVDLVVGHGDAPGGHWVHWARDQGVDPRGAGGADASPRVDPHWRQVYTTDLPARVHPSVYIGERAEQRVRDAADDADPFFLFVSFPDPHHPFAPPREYADLYRPEDVPLPVGFDQSHDASPPHVQKMIAERGTPNSDPTMAFAVTEEQYRAAAVAQFGLITLMDEQIGRVLDALEETGQAENTIVLFTSDHGDLFGDHGLMLKHFVHYRAVTRVPLTVRLPERCGAVPEQNASLVSTADLAPTLLEACGVPAFRGIQGHSLLPLLRQERTAVRRRLLIEEDQPFGLPGLPGPVRIRTLLTADGRLTRYFGTEHRELYDHRRDPDELVNVAEVQPGLAADLGEQMLEEMAGLQDTGTAPTAAA